MEIGGDSGVVLDGGVGEVQTFVGVVANHYLDVLVVGALEKEFSRHVRGKESVNYWAKGEASVSGHSDLYQIGHD